MNTAKLLKSFVFVLLSGLLPCVVNAQINDDPDKKYAVELLKPGTEAPNFKLKTPEGRDLSLSSSRASMLFWIFGLRGAPIAVKTFLKCSECTIISMQKV